MLKRYYSKGRGTFMLIDGKRVAVELWLEHAPEDPQNGGTIYYATVEWIDRDGYSHESASLGATPRPGGQQLGSEKCIRWARGELKRMWQRLSDAGGKPRNPKIIRDNCAKVSGNWSGWSGRGS